MKPTNDFKQAVKAYLDARAKIDTLFAASYAKPGKNIDECCAYIMGEAKKQGNAVCISDDVVFGWAVHYYDEDDIKVNKLPANTRATVSSASKQVELTEEEKKQVREAALQKLQEENYAALKKPKKAKRVETEDKQMTLF